MPAAPCTWMARSMTSHATCGATALISTPARALPSGCRAGRWSTPPSDTTAAPGRSRCGTWRSAAAPRPARPAACRTRCASAPGRPSTPTPARRRRARACSGGCGPAPAGPGRSRSRRPPRRAGWPPAPARCRRRSRSARAGPASRTPASTAGSFTPGVSIGHQHHRLLLMAGRIGVGAAHHDQDLAARVGRTRDPPLAAVDDVVAAVAGDRGLDVARIAGGHRGLGHREPAADLAVPAAAPATACAAPRWRTGAGSPCCRCRGRRS